MNKDDPQNYEMTPEREEHLRAVTNDIKENIDFKYRLGERKHGGNLWERDLLDEALQEGYDLLVYLTSLKQLKTGEAMRYLKDHQVIGWLVKNKKSTVVESGKEVRINDVSVKNLNGKTVHVIVLEETK